MSRETKIRESHRGRKRTIIRTRKIAGSKGGRSESVICPFTLEAIRDCAMHRKAAPHAVSRYSLEGCMSSAA